MLICASTIAIKTYLLMMYMNCCIAAQLPQFPPTSNSHKMLCSKHFIPFSVFGVSISPNCSFVQAQSQLRLIVLMMYTNCCIAAQLPQFPPTSNSHKMPYSKHFIPFSVSGASISLNCSIVQAQSQLRLIDTLHHTIFY